ncbi:MAG: class I SAM-dependent methyltransferase [Spongiibacteraceae bacterium]
MNTITKPIAVLLDVDKPLQCQQLAEQLRLSLVSEEQRENYSYLLVFTAHGLAIVQTGAKAAGPVFVDFSSGTTDHRRKQGGGELIVKAVAGSKSQLPVVLDTTAGLGRDSFVLASRGYSVTLCERSAVIAAVLADGLQRGLDSSDSELRAIVQRMQLKRMDALAYMRTEAQLSPPDVVVIDPMFPHSKKSALVKKDMQAFQQLVGADEDSDQLLMQALLIAKHRVVVKRPKKAEFLAARKPNFSVAGKAIRFDIYSLKAFAK